jgi:hypothetical protein
MSAGTAVFDYFENIPQGWLDLRRRNACAFQLIRVGRNQGLNFHFVARLYAKNGNRLGVIIAKYNGFGRWFEGIGGGTINLLCPGATAGENDCDGEESPCEQATLVHGASLLLNGELKNSAGTLDTDCPVKPILPLDTRSENEFPRSIPAPAQPIFVRAPEPADIF